MASVVREKAGAVWCAPLQLGDGIPGSPWSPASSVRPSPGSEQSGQSGSANGEVTEYAWQPGTGKTLAVS